MNYLVLGIALGVVAALAVYTYYLSHRTSGETPEAAAHLQAIADAQARLEATFNLKAKDIATIGAEIVEHQKALQQIYQQQGLTTDEIIAKFKQLGL